MTDTLSNLPMGQLSGFIIETNRYLLDVGEPIQLKRTWKERLFSLPWQPLQAFKTVRNMIPSRNIHIIKNRLIMHPAMQNEILKYLKEKNNAM